MEARSYRGRRPGRVGAGGTKTIDLALAGCGRWGSRILADLVALGARVRVADPDAEARRSALATGASETAAVADALGPVDAAIVATPTLRHAETIERLASRRVPIFCEKPLTADAGSARRLAEALEGRLWMMEKWRWHPAVEAIAAIAREGRLGRPRALTTRRLQPSISGYDVDAIWVLAPHDLSIAAEILGRVPSPDRAAASFENGSVVGLRAEGGEGDVSFSFEVSVRAPERRREIELVCGAGTVRWTSADENAIRIDGLGRRAVGSDPPLTRELRSFLAYLAGGPPPKAGAREGAAAVESLERARSLAGITRDGRPRR